MSTNSEILDYDGTPVSALREMIADLQKEIAELKHTLSTIHTLCNTPHWISERRWKIQDLSARTR